MPSITGQQLQKLAQQFTDMAREVEAKNRIDPDPDLKLKAQNLRFVAIDLSSSAILATIGALQPHYDAMLSIVRDLKEEIASQQHSAKVLNLAEAALALASAVVTGNPLAVLSAIEHAKALIS